MATQTEPREGQPVIEVVLPTFIMKPGQEEIFYPSQVKKIAEEKILSKLEPAKKGDPPMEYDEDEVKDWVVEIADKIKADVKLLNIPRYKVVVQVTIGSQSNQGVRIASRCLWNTGTDNYASFSYTNSSLWCNAMIFGVYTE